MNAKYVIFQVDNGWIVYYDDHYIYVPNLEDLFSFVKSEEPEEYPDFKEDPR